MHYIRTPFQNVWVCLCDRQGVFKETWLNCNSKKDKVKGGEKFYIVSSEGHIGPVWSKQMFIADCHPNIFKNSVYSAVTIEP